MRAPLGQVHDARRKTVRMQAEAHHVDGTRHEMRCNAFVQLRQRAVRRHDLPMPVDCKSRIGLVALQHQIDGAAHGRQRRVVERAFDEHRCVSGSHEQNVALAHRNLQLFGEMQNHLAARRRSTRLHKTQMARRDVRFTGEVELAQTPALSPIAQVMADGGIAREAEVAMAPTLGQREVEIHDAGGNGAAKRSRTQSLRCGVVCAARIWTCRSRSSMLT